MHDSDITDRGFKPSNLCNLHPESFFKMDVSAYNEENTLMQVWPDNNSYQYVVLTDVRSTIERGTITRPKQLDEVVQRHFKYSNGGTY